VEEEWLRGERKAGDDFYAVLGLKKECTGSELRKAYKKLALRWHPDRCSAPGNSKFVEEAKKKFQDIQQAYSVIGNMLSVQGMGEFLDEMAMMMSQTKPNENGKESFEELQNLFDEMFQGDIGVLALALSLLLPVLLLHMCRIVKVLVPITSVESRQDIGREGSKRRIQGEAIGKRRHGRKQKVASGHDVSSNDYSGVEPHCGIPSMP
ncbi:Chaperone DnaJ-domain superfamily protein, partial [Prunus dulcis]